VHSIWKYVEDLPIWAQLALFATFLGSLGFSGKEVATLFIRMIRNFIEHRRAERIMDYLFSQTNPQPQDQYGQTPMTNRAAPDSRGLTPLSHKYCKSLVIAKAVKIKPLLVLRILGKLEEQQRVERQGTLDHWRVTIHELHNRTWRNK
jgi:hypothetical protein